MNRDQFLLIALKFFRMLAYGQTVMILVPFFLAIDFSDVEIGRFMTYTLLGDVALSTGVAIVADRMGRRLMLCASSFAMLVSGLVFAQSRQPWALLAAAVFGVISPSGDEVGPFRAIEESVLAHITHSEARAFIFAWQNFFGTAGVAIGAVSAGWLQEQLQQKYNNPAKPYQIIFLIYSALAAVSLVLNVALSSAVELQSVPASAHLEAATPAQPEEAEQSLAQNRTETEDSVEAVLTQDLEEVAPLLGVQVAKDESQSIRKLGFALCFLFGIDSLAYGFMNNSWLVEYLEREFGTSPTLLGQFFFLATLISALTALPSAFLTHKIGPVLAIGLTKIGAGLFGGAVPWARSSYGAMGFVLLRSLFDTMDVVPRQVFIVSVVPPEERTFVLGLVNVIKTLARSIGPVFTGILASHGDLWLCFLTMGSLEMVFAALIMNTFL